LHLSLQNVSVDQTIHWVEMAKERNLGFNGKKKGCFRTTGARPAVVEEEQKEVLGAVPATGVRGLRKECLTGRASAAVGEVLRWSLPLPHPALHDCLASKTECSKFQTGIRKDEDPKPKQQLRYEYPVARITLQVQLWYTLYAITKVRLRNDLNCCSANRRTNTIALSSNAKFSNFVATLKIIRYHRTVIQLLYMKVVAEIWFF
jgi:hypothetical protein